MFSLRFAVVALLTLTISGQQYDGTKPSGNGEKGYPFGKLRLSEDGKKEEVILVNPIEQTQVKQDQKQHVQPLPSPCVGSRPLTRLAHPGDKTKYIYCRDEFHYEIFSCPNSGEYNYQTGSCETIVPVSDLCAEEKPCLNGGQCSVLSNSTFKCTCRPDWTGERCETPLNSCVKKPCGPNAECRILKTTDYDQDYVCVCNAKKGYGLNCDEIVPNPCLKSSEQFFPFAYSQHAYLQCDGEVVYFQPCGPLLYWNQEEKVCDRKRPPKLDLPTLLKTYGVTEEELQPSTTTTTTTTIATTTTTTSRPLQEDRVPFIPARIADRQQGLYAQNVQNKPWSQPQQNQQFGSLQWLSQVPSSNTQNEQRFVPQSQAYQNYRLAPITTTPAPVVVPSWQNQQQFQDQNREPEVETTTPTTSSPVNIPSWQQNRPMNQWSGYQVPSSQSWQNFRIVTTTPAPIVVPSWQNQQQFQDQNKESEVETITTTTTIIPSTATIPSWFQTPQSWQNFRVVTTTPAPIVVPSWQNQQPQIEDQDEELNIETTTTTTPSTTTLPSWLQTRPMNQWSGYQAPQSQSWQNFRVVTTTTTPASVAPSWQNQQQFQDQNKESEDETATTTTTTTTLVPSTTTVPSWLQAQRNGYQAPQSWQNFRVVTPTPAPVVVPSWQNQQQFQDQNEESEVETTTTTTLVPTTTTVPSWLQTRPMNQWNGYQVPQSQSWQNFRVVTTTPAPVVVPSWQNQQQFQDQNEESEDETTTTTTTVVPSTTTIPSWLQTRPMNQWNGYQVPSQNQYQQSSWETTPSTPNVVPSPVQTSEQSWQTKPTNQWNSNSVSPTIGFQPHQSPGVISSSQSRLNSQTFSTLQPILPISTTTTPQTFVVPAAQNQWNTNQFSQSAGLTQQHGVSPIQKSLDQIPSWSTNQQVPSQWNQQSTGNHGRFQNILAPTQTWPQTGNMEKQHDQSKTLESGWWNFRA